VRRAIDCRASTPAAFPSLTDLDFQIDELQRFASAPVVEAHLAALRAERTALALVLGEADRLRLEVA
jgi:hypothetical protein